MARYRRLLFLNFHSEQEKGSLSRQAKNRAHAYTAPVAWTNSFDSRLTGQHQANVAISGQHFDSRASIQDAGRYCDNCVALRT